MSGYVGGNLFDQKTRAQQRKAVEGGSSDPPGPGENAARLGILRYETECGTVWGYTGNCPGYTQFMAASPNGRCSVTVSVNEQLSPVQGAPGVFDALRRAEGKAVCAALADGLRFCAHGLMPSRRCVEKIVKSAHLGDAPSDRCDYRYGAGREYVHDGVQSRK